MSIKDHPGIGTQKPIEVIVDDDRFAGEAGRSGVEVVSLAIDEFESGSDPYNQTGRFVSLALKEKGFD